MNDYIKMQEDLKDNGELQKKYEAAKQAAIAAGAKSDCEMFINAAKAMGYEVTAADVEKSFADAQELSDDDLAQISGGVEHYGEDMNYHEEYCWTLWHCFTVTCHTATTTKSACWSDYSCLTVNVLNQPWSERYSF